MSRELRPADRRLTGVTDLPISWGTATPWGTAQKDLLNEWTTPIGSAVFAIPGERPPA